MIALISPLGRAPLPPANLTRTESVPRNTITATYSLGPAIPTVGILAFTTSLPNLTNAQTHFGLTSTGPTMTAPVELSQPGYRTLLLGMKGNSQYKFRIIAASGAETCTSEDYNLTTGTVPRELSLPADGLLRSRPLRELETLRYHEMSSTGVSVNSAAPTMLSSHAGDALELKLNLEPGTATEFALETSTRA